MRELRRRQLLAAAGGGLLGAVTLSTGNEPGVRREWLPRDGSVEPAFQPVEDLFLAQMVEWNASAAALGIAVDGEVVVERAYGWFDRRWTDPLEPDALFRIASVSKAITKAAVRRLVREDVLAYDTAVVPRLDVPVPDDADPRLDAITVEHLLRHRGGWDRTESLDPMFVPRRIADDLDLNRPPERREVVEWTLARPLDFPPGERRVYSNFGYAMLGTLIEDVTGEPYQKHVERHVLDPTDVEGVHRARTRPADRPLREVAYESDRWCPDAVDVDALRPVRCPDGGFYVEAMDASGGHVATVRALLRFMEDYWLTGHPRREGETPRIGVKRGDLPGTFAFADQLRPTRNVAVLFNRGADDEGPFLRSLQERLDEIVPG